MDTKNNFKYVRDYDHEEWVFLDSCDDKEYLTSHNGCCCISDINESSPYFSIKTTHIMEDYDVDCIRDVTPKEIEEFITIARLKGYEFDEITQKFKKIN